MIESIKKLFGLGPKTDYAQLIKNGAIILDVRTKGEYAGGHVKGSINIPLDQLSGNINKLNKEKTIITCCASGMRSGVAKGQLKSMGFKEVYNGGSWLKVNSYK